MESEEVPLRRRAGAAGIAACVSAVVVTPLDVVKTRMQAQGFTHVSAATPFRHVVPAGAFPPRRPLRISLAPGCPPRCPTTGNPTVTRLLCAPECNTYPSTIDVVRKILRQEGPRALFRGTGTALAIAVPTVGIYLPCYDIALANARAALAANDATKPWVGVAPAPPAPPVEPSPCLRRAPRSRERGRKRSEAEARKHPPAPWAAESPRGVSEQRRCLRLPLRGALGAPRGVDGHRADARPRRPVLGAVLVRARATPRRPLRAGGGGRGAEPERERAPGVNFASGVVAGAGSPRSRRRSTSSRRACKSGTSRGGFRGDEGGGRRRRRRGRGGGGAAGRGGVWSELAAVAREGGARSLFAGWAPRAARAAPTCGIVLVAYEMAKGGRRRGRRFVAAREETGTRLRSFYMKGTRSAEASRRRGSHRRVVASAHVERILKRFAAAFSLEPSVSRDSFTHSQRRRAYKCPSARATVRGASARVDRRDARR